MSCGRIALQAHTAQTPEDFKKNGANIVNEKKNQWIRVYQGIVQFLGVQRTDKVTIWKISLSRESGRCLSRRIDQVQTEDGGTISPRSRRLEEATSGERLSITSYDGSV